MVLPAISMPSVAKDAVWNVRASASMGVSRAARPITSGLLVNTPGMNSMMDAADQVSGEHNGGGLEFKGLCNRRRTW